MESKFGRLIVFLFLVTLTACGRSDLQPTQGPIRGPTSDDGPIKTGQLPRVGFFNGETLKASDIDTIVGRVKPGGVLVISEEHGNQTHYRHQKLALEALAKTGQCTVSVGLEFLSWTRQKTISEYFDGALSESEFLKQSDWGGNPFADYRDQALFPQKTGGRLLGINAPRSLTGAISKVGVEHLSPEQQLEMPPQFTLGSAAYRERFDVIIGGHVPANAVDRYFAAQSVWDDTMAWQAVDFLKQNPSHCLAMIVGDFHAAWDGGLPDRLKARGIAHVTVISQVETDSLSEEDLSAALGPSSHYGSRADAIWLSQTPVIQ